MIIVSVSEQRLYHRRTSGVWYTYPVSTALAGCGNQRNSLQTPLGKHRISAKIGEGMPIYTAFIGREPVGIFDPDTSDPKHDWILTRILWLDGAELGKNLRGPNDTESRYIYIHGTHEEDKLGQPASHGCIRMGNLEMLELFEHSFVGENVLIRK